MNTHISLVDRIKCKTEMKCFYILLLCGFFSQSLRSQSLIVPATEKTTFKFKEADETYTIVFELKDKVPDQEVMVHLKDFNNGTAALGKDYVYVGSRDVTVAPNQNSFSVPILIKQSAFVEYEKFFDLQISFENDWGPTKTVRFSIGSKSTNKPKVTKSQTLAVYDIDTTAWSVKALVGSNFDFFDAPTFKNFAGELNLFFPNFSVLKINSKSNKAQQYGIGGMLGFFNYRYFTADSSRSKLYSQLYYVDPRTSVPQPNVTKYVNEVYALNTRTTYNNWGFYFGPTIALDRTDNYKLYLSLQTELVWRSQILNNTKVAVRKDTSVLTDNDITETRGGYHLTKNISQRESDLPAYKPWSFNDTYFSLAFPMKLSLEKSFEFYANPAFGFSSFEYIKTDTIQAGVRGSGVNETIIYVESKDRKLSPFFVLKFQVSTSISPVDIVVGGEVRTVSYSPDQEQRFFKALYLAASMSLDKLKR